MTTRQIRFQTPMMVAMLLMLLCAVPSRAAQTDEEWARADAQTVRLPPAAFTELPADVRKELERRGCTVPQPVDSKSPQNVLRGRFVTANQMDIAVLCSKDRVSTILLFRGGRTRTIDEFGTEPDATFLRVLDDSGRIGFSRVLSLSEPDYIMRYNSRYEGPKPSLNHEGVNDRFVGRGSGVWFWSEGHWLPLRGAYRGKSRRAVTDTMDGARAHVRLYQDADWDEWLRLSAALFADEAPIDLVAGMREFLTRTDAALFVAARSTGEALAGYVEVGERMYADGCGTSPVGFIEEWYVDPDVRRLGIGRALLDAAEQWALAQGYMEMASDALLDNVVSHRAHERAGYEEVERAVRFRKPLGEHAGRAIARVSGVERGAAVNIKEEEPQGHT